MAQSFAYYLRVGTLLHHQGGVGVAKIMEPQLRQPSFSYNVGESMRYDTRPERGAAIGLTYPIGFVGPMQQKGPFCCIVHSRCLPLLL